MKKIIINILTVLFILLPIFGIGSRYLFGVCVVLWPIVTIVLVVIYFKNYKIYKFKTSNIVLYSNKEKFDKEKSENIEEIKD